MQEEQLINNRDTDPRMSHNEIIIEPSLPGSDRQRPPWYKRTFAPLSKGGIRGNIFLMMVTTTGCAFFYLPLQAKKTGLFLTMFMLLFVMSVSYYSSSLLYLGFKATKASTYDQCMDKVLGVKMGFLSNFMIFIHTFAATVSVWLFSFDFLFYAVVSLIYSNETEAGDLTEKKQLAFYIFSGVMGFTLFISSIFGKIDFLKKISMIGIFIIFYLIIVFLCLLPNYYKFYKSDIEIVLAKFDHNIFVTNGICFYLFLNQYTVLPICNNLKRIRSQRIMKIIKRTDLISFFIYIMFTLIGYFSMPNTVLGTPQEKDYELFLIRPPINGVYNRYVTAGQILFGINLIIAVLVKGHFCELYFEQIRKNLYKVYRYRRNLKKQNLPPPDYKKQSSFEYIYQNLDISYAVPTEEIVIEKEIEIEEIDKYKNLKNLFFFIVVTFLAIGLQKYLHKFVSLVGSFVGVFEIVIFPLSMVLIINQHNQIVGTCEKIVILTIGTIFSLMGFASFFTTLIS